MPNSARHLEHGATRRYRRVLWTIPLSCLALLAPLPATAAAEEETHLFDAALSLTGDCSTSATIDPIPDPGCPGGEHPPKPFTKHGGVAVDPSGNRYVASTGGVADGSQGRIDVFSSSGEFITEISIQLPGFGASLAVDSQGNLYVAKSNSAEYTQRIVRYEPTVYHPAAAGEIEYGAAPVVVPNPHDPANGWGDFSVTLAINPQNDHLFVATRPGDERTTNDLITEFSSATEGNTFVGGFPLPGAIEGGAYVRSFALDAVRDRIYVSDLKENPAAGVPGVVKVFDLEAPHELLFTIDGSTTPTERFVSETRVLALAVDETTGHLFVGDLEAPTRRIYEFDVAGDPVSTIGEGRLKAAGAALLQLAYDDSPTSATEGYLFVPSGSGPGRSLAFEPIPVTVPPVVGGLTVSDVSTTDAILHGTIDPGGVSTTYRIEYTSEQAFQEHGEHFEGATLAGEGTLSPANEEIVVSAAVSGLSAGAAYRFRVVAENEFGEDEADASFATFELAEAFGVCPNQGLRTGPSAALPDCRAYELVTPVDTNGHAPFGTRIASNAFTTRQVSPAGDKVPFVLEGAPLSGMEGTGGQAGDPYLATRGSAGWSTSYRGPSPVEAASAVPGTGSPDQGYSFWLAQGSVGSALIEGKQPVYVEYPDGHSELLGRGSLGIDPGAQGRLITTGGTHIIFSTGGTSPKYPPVQLEPDAAPDGTRAIYDRTADGTTHVVSLQPGDVPFGTGEDALLLDASPDGVGIVFEVGNTLYLRYDNSQTFAIGSGIQFAGIAEGGGRVLYMEEGNLKAFDVATNATVTFSVSGDVTPVTVAADGSTAYFVSPTVLTVEPNPSGEEAQPGAENLYRSVEGQIAFVATVTERDVEGEAELDGLGLWLYVLNSEHQGELARIPARTTPDGTALLFKSRAQLTGYDSEGHAEIYRYDAAGSSLHCLSCNPTGAAATADATLQYDSRGEVNQLFIQLVWLENLRADGRRAFFESEESLVAADTDGLRDVYEWEDQGVGSCAKASGCLYLISSGQSARDEFLWAVSKSGDDVFFFSGDLLGGGDTDETPSVYDARVNGGFPPAPSPPGECLGEACQPAAVVPNDPTPASSAYEGAGNVAPGRRPSARPCPKGKRVVHRAGKRRCVRRHAKNHPGKKKARANGNGRAGR